MTYNLYVKSENKLLIACHLHSWAFCRGSTCTTVIIHQLITKVNVVIYHKFHYSSCLIATTALWCFRPWSFYLTHFCLDRIVRITQVFYFVDRKERYLHKTQVSIDLYLLQVTLQYFLILLPSSYSCHRTSTSSRGYDRPVSRMVVWKWFDSREF